MLCDFYNEALEYQENLLVKYYVKHGHEVTVIASTFDSVFDYYSDRHDKTAPPRIYEDRGAKIIKLQYRYNILNRLRAYTRIDEILAREAPDLIYVHDIMLNFPEAIRYVQSHPGCRMIMDYHADYSNSGRNALSIRILHGVIRKWFLDRARPHLSRIFPIVPASAVFLNEVYKVPHMEMEVLPLGADTDQVAETKKREEGRRLRKLLGISANDLVIFTGGKLVPAKKTELLIEAVCSLRDVSLHLIVVGDSDAPNAEYKKQLMELAGGHSRIHFIGWLGRTDIYSYLDMANLAVFPASQSILWQQAIAMGLPLVVGDTGHQDISYLNLHENIVILRSDEISSERLAEEIRGLARDPIRLQRMGQGALRVADECLDWNKLIDRTLRYNTVASTST
jgi:glycosyltransferase involved in cell wall biosynthesis